MLALWGFYRRSPGLAGFGIAWAGLIKLFPFVLILPLAVVVVRQILSRQITATGKEAMKALAACAVSTAVLAAVSSLTGQSWTEFFQKISVQFQDSSYLNNSVGISNIFLTLGLEKSLSIILPQATVFFALLWILWMKKEEDLRERLPAVSLLLLASMAWLTQTWFNYYAVIGFFLIPGLLRRNRRAAISLLALFALGGFLPDFGFAYPDSFTFLPIVKVLGYLLLPLVAIAMEIKDIKQVHNSAPGRDGLSQWFFGREQLILSVGAALSVVFICAEIYRANSASLNLNAGRDLYRKGAVSESRQFFETAVKHAPRDAAARIELAQAMADLQDFEGALAQYRKAVELNPTYAPTRSRLGVLLVQSGNTEEALAQFSEAAKIMPYDETIQFNYGATLLSIGQKDEAAAHLQTALDIDPDFSPARNQLESISSLRQ
jgi:tetratricopeptide (TPR) repeat protein